MTFDQFQQEYQKLKLSFPAIPNHNLRCENSDYGDYQSNCKNCYLSFDNSQCEDSVYLYDSFMSKHILDGDYIIESELVYDSIDAVKCYNSTYLNYCARLYDSRFCWDCSDSHDLFGCCHLKHKQYCIGNVQYTKEEYFNNIPELLKKSSDENLKNLYNLSQKYPVTVSYTSHCENCDYGDQVHYSKNLFLCFDSAYSEDGGYLYDAHHNKSCWDLTQTFHSELCYECNDSFKLYSCFFMDFCENDYESQFCHNSVDSDHLFGCTFLRRKKYHFLNKPYPENIWQQMVKEVMESFRQSVR